MRAVQVTRAGGPLEVVERDEPEPAPAEVRVRVNAGAALAHGAEDHQ